MLLIFVVVVGAMSSTMPMAAVGLLIVTPGAPDFMLMLGSF